MTRVLVCGGRDVIDRDFVWGTLDRLHAARPVTHLVSGGARGADTLAELWANSRGVPKTVFEADWNTLGRSAGHIRNQRMLDEGDIEVVVAFPGGAGTRDMVRRSQAAGKPVVSIPHPGPLVLP